MTKKKIADEGSTAKTEPTQDHSPDTGPVSEELTKWLEEADQQDKSKQAGSPDKDSDTGASDADKPWHMRQEARRPAYVRPPDPDKELTPHRSEPAVFYYRKNIPRVFITPEAYKRMCLYVELAEKEVGWLGTVRMTRDGDFLIENTYLLEQEVTATETELSSEGQALLVEELLAKGDAGFEEVNRLRFWGHSHVRMGINPSGTDESTMDRFFEEGLPWYVRGIFNKKGRAEFCVFLYEQGIRIDDVPWFVVDPKNGNVLLEYTRPKFTSSFFFSPPPKPLTNPGELTLGTESLWNRRPTPEPEPKKPALPPELVVDDKLRLEVKAEFDLKVKERKFFSIWSTIFGSDDDDKKKALAKPDEVEVGKDDKADNDASDKTPPTGKPD